MPTTHATAIVSFSKLFTSVVLIVKSSTVKSSLPFSLSETSYQVSLADANKGDAVCDRVRCDPKLTEGREMVRAAPRESSTETFKD
jgi:hypothetical protein